MSFEREVVHCREQIDELDYSIVFFLGVMRAAQIRWRSPESATAAHQAMHTAAWLRFSVTAEVGRLKIENGVISTIQAARRQQVFDNVAQHQTEFDERWKLPYAEGEVAVLYHQLHDASVAQQEAQKTAHRANTPAA